MTRQHIVTTGFILAGLLLIPTIAASQQADPQAGFVRQRAPGVPMAPRPGELAPDIVARERAADPNLYLTPQQQHARNAPRPNRDPPMPRPVPSIIAP
jgi:hypothetical protein